MHRLVSPHSACLLLALSPVLCGCATKSAVLGALRPRITAVELQVAPSSATAHWRSAPVVQTSDPVAFGPLLAILDAATPSKDHKCEDVGEIRLLLENGTDPAALRILPGHDPAYYEFRYEQRLYRVERTAFVEALRRLGVPAVPL